MLKFCVDDCWGGAGSGCWEEGVCSSYQFGDDGENNLGMM